MADKSNENKQSRLTESTQELLDISNVVAETLSKLNEVNREQFEGIVNLVTNLSREMINLVEEANDILRDDKSLDESIEPIEDRLSKISNKAKESIDAIGATLNVNMDDKSKSEPCDSASDLIADATQAISNAYSNAVVAQQQANILLQAAVTQGISNLFSVVTSSLAIVEKKRVNDK